MSTLNARSFSSLKNIEVKGQGNTRGGIVKYKGTNATNPLASTTGTYGTFIDSEGNLNYSKNGVQTVMGGATENVTATNVITAAENGKTFFLNSATEFVSTLPAPFAGARFTFIVVAAPASASYTVVTNASANIIKGQAYVCADAAGDAGTTDDTITFVDGQAVAGDRVELYSDGTSWFAYAYCAVAAGVTFTTAS